MNFNTKFLLKSSLVFLAGIFFICIDLPAQFNTRHGKHVWQLSINPVLNRNALKDLKFSSLVFTGVNAGGALTLSFIKEKVQHQLSGFYGKGKLSATNFAKEKVDQNVFKLDYFNLYLLSNPENNGLKITTGGAIQYLHATRVFLNFINTDKSFETEVSIGPVIDLQYLIPGKLKGFTLSNRLVVPLVFSFSQSPYLSNRYPGNSEKESNSFFKNNQVSAIPNLLRITDNLTLEKMIDDNHFIAVTYAWDYYKINGSRKVIQATHQLGILFRYNF